MCVSVRIFARTGIWQISGHFDLAPPSRNTKEYTYHTTLSTLPTSITFYSDNTYAYSPPSSLNPSIDPLISSSGHYTLNSTHLLLTTSLTSLANQPIAIYLSGTCPSEGFIKGRAFSGDRYVYPLSHPKVLEGPVIFKEEEAKGSWTMKRIFKDVEGDKWSNAEYEGIQYNTPSSLSLMSPKKYIIALEGLRKKSNPSDFRSQRKKKIAHSKRKKYGKYYDVPTSNSGGRYVGQDWTVDFDDFQTGEVEVYGNYTFVVKLGGGERRGRWYTRCDGGEDGVVSVVLQSSKFGFGGGGLGGEEKVYWGKVEVFDGVCVVEGAVMEGWGMEPVSVGKFVMREVNEEEEE
ncbi:hypothetical protein TrST_g13764 [Triparma strigata]|uniref:Uncharacterized protein n=1 Tax=Triparma strigata TaxID=1606541 RepID=A0A9W7A1J5_9STRA|nr:hypothetical protein TrST_g13764 [Triparma strigata]